MLKWEGKEGRQKINTGKMLKNLKVKKEKKKSDKFNISKKESRMRVSRCSENKMIGRAEKHVFSTVIGTVITSIVDK